jgi:hypothetical protein
VVAFSKFLPLVTQLGTYLKMGLDQYAFLKNEGKDAGPDVIAAFLQMKMADWNPSLAGKTLLDDETRAAGARFLAGVAVNFSK